MLNCIWSLKPGLFRAKGKKAWRRIAAANPYSVWMMTNVSLQSCCQRDVFHVFCTFSNNGGSSFTAYCGETDIKKYMILRGFKLENYINSYTGGPPLVRSPLVRFPLVRILLP